jgi:hypothetical protein
MINTKPINKVTVSSILKVFSDVKKCGYITALALISFTSFAEQDFDADIQKLNSKAGKSSDLYVEPSFNFKTFKTVTLDLSVTDNAGMPSANIILRISSVSNNGNTDQEERWAKKSVISLVRTDQFGRIYRQVEMSNSVDTLLIELNEQTANNKVQIDLPDSLHVSHTFEIK